jgi:hypothetical protein
MGAISMWPVCQFETPRERANFYFGSLHVLRTHMFRYYFFNQGSRLDKPKKLGLNSLARLVGLTSSLLPMWSTLGTAERTADVAAVDCLVANPCRLTKHGARLRSSANSSSGKKPTQFIIHAINDDQNAWL